MPRVCDGSVTQRQCLPLGDAALADRFEVLPGGIFEWTSNDNFVPGDEDQVTWLHADLEPDDVA